MMSSPDSRLPAKGIEPVRRLLATLSATTLLTTLCLLMVTAQAQAAGRCESARLPSQARAELEVAFRRAARLPGGFRLGDTAAIHYGTCGGTRYGFAEFSPARGQTITEAQAIGLQDHSFLYVRVSGAAWRDLPLQRLCAPGPLPPALAAQWHLSFLCAS